MITGAKAGKGGRALSAHLLKAEAGQVVEAVTPRGVVSRGDLHAQLREIVAGASHGRTGKPCYHVHADPPPTAPDCQTVLTAWWQAFEIEFGLERQPYVGAQHLKYGRRHEHRIYGLVRADGRAVDTSMDFQRRTYVSIIVGHRLGLEPAPTPHARAVAYRLAQEGKDDVVRWMAGHGLIDADRPIAPVTPEERLVEARTGIALADIRARCLAAWNASHDGIGFQRELAARGLTLRQGTVGPVVVDESGTAHSVTRAIGAASRIATGNRIAAAAVKARLAGMHLKEVDHGSVGRNLARSAVSLSDPDGAARSPGAGGGRGGRSDLVERGPGGSRPGGEQAGRRGDPSPGRGLFAARSGRRAYARARLASALVDVDWRSVHEAERLADKLAAIAAGAIRPAWVPGKTDIWGVPIS